ncbi:MAG: B12-binding domain-containing radical SAM protein [Deltaproteobacteria bacterium]|nr:B12-binding domain-containing radical SAM protein [Deltaproteobacteria bacterium]
MAVTHPIRILLVMADAAMHKLYLGPLTRSMREAPLSLITLAALTGDDPEIEYRVVDESVQRVPLDADVDLVGISVLTGTARRCYALADHFRRRQIPVVLGGVHVTLLPDEARQHADCIVVGMADRSWPQLVQDFKAGRLRAEYIEPPGLEEYYPGIPTPRWELQDAWRYNLPYTVPATRGCIHKCDFCTVPAVWPRLQKRPIADVVRDIRAVPSRRFCMNDVSPFDDAEYAKELLRAIAPLKKTWGALATTENMEDPELLELLARSGCRFLLLGFESVNQESLNRIAKAFNRQQSYEELMARLHRAGIVVQGCFVFGFDEDGPDVFARTVQRVQELRIDIPRYSIYTPYPGSRLFARLQGEGRLLSYDWGDYDTMHVVFRPLGMSPAELYEGFRWSYRQTFKLTNILRRTLASGRMFPVAFVGNLTYRLFVKRLFRQKGFEMPVNQSAPAAAAQVRLSA